MPTVDTWLDLFLSGKFMLGRSWAVNTAGYWAQRNRPNVRVVSFKSMKRDLRTTVLDVARFLDIHVPDAVIQEVCRQSSFEYMKRNDHKFAMGKMVLWRPEGAMIRKGSQGGSSELLDPEKQRRVDSHFMSELKRLGSDFPYEEFCDVAR
jgi:aryl sulfotransferase